MSIRKSNAVWQGDLKNGNGTMKVGSGAYEGAYSFASRFEDGKGTNPEEMIAAAHAGCFSMALANDLAEGGFEPRSVQTVANVHLDPDGDGFSISKIELEVEADVPGIDPAAFRDYADATKVNCPVSKALSAVNIELKAQLK